MDKLIAQLEPGSEVFKYVVHYATYSFETSKIMGMDKAFVHMVDNYYKPDLAFWMDEEKLETIKEKANQKRNTLIGDVIPELVLMDTAGNWISTHKDLKQKYVLLYFYDPDCGHCKKETPKLAEFYKDFDQSLLGVYAVSSETGKKWTDFIKKNEMNFYNVAIPRKAYEDAEYATSLITSRKTNYTSLKYQETYDVYSTPKILLVDENRVIRAKDIGVDQVGNFINRLEGIETEDSSEESESESEVESEN
jgi:peroxiredoxin